MPPSTPPRLHLATEINRRPRLLPDAVVALAANTGEILPAPRTGVASSLLLLDSVGSGRNHHPRHPRSSTGGLYPGKKPIAEAGGLGGFLEEASSAYVSAAAAAAASSKAWASDALWALVSCVGGEEERGQQEMMSPPILPYPGYMRPEEEEELSVWGGVTSTE